MHIPTTLAEKNAHCRAVIGHERSYTCARPGDLDLRFEGWLISKKTPSNEQNNATNSGGHLSERNTVEVDLFLTVTGLFVAQLVRVIPNKHGPLFPALRKSKAKAAKEFPELIEWLRADGHGWLGESSKNSLQIAAARLPWLNNALTEKI